jgi:perosamine synthetase
MVKEGTNIEALQERLLKEGIQTRRIFTPIVEFPMYRDEHKERYKNSCEIYERGLCLPSSCLNSEEDVYFVCKKLGEILK